jgi:hypothetical protein
MTKTKIEKYFNKDVDQGVGTYQSTDTLYKVIHDFSIILEELSRTYIENQIARETFTFCQYDSIIII